MDRPLADDEEQDAEEAPNDGNGEGDQAPGEGPCAVIAIRVVGQEGIGRADGPSYAANTNDAAENQGNRQSHLELPITVDRVELLIVGWGLEVGRGRLGGIYRGRCGQ